MTTILRFKQKLIAPPPGTPVLAPPWSTIITSDSFLRTGALGSTDAGLGGAPMTWIGDPGKFNANNGYAQPNAATTARISVNGASYADGQMSIRPLVMPSGDGFALDVRRQGALTQGSSVAYRFILNGNGTISATNPGGAQIMSGVPFALGDTVAVRAEGTTFSLLINDVIMKTVQDTHTQAAGAFNLALLNAASQGFQFTDFMLKAK